MTVEFWLFYYAKIMIVDTFKELVILTPPKTGSMNLNRTLGQYPKVLYVNGFNPINHIDHHTICVANSHIFFKKVILVRHPYDRFLSLWKHYFLYDDEKDKGFDRWFDRVVEDDLTLYWMYRYTISRWLLYSQHAMFSRDFTRGELGRQRVQYNDFWKIESIDSILEEHYPRVQMIPKYPLSDILPDGRPNRQAPEVPIPKLTQDQNKKLSNWMAEDAERFDYVL